MGCFLCFDSKEEEEQNPAKESDDRKQGLPTISSNITGLSSGADRLRSRSNIASKKELRIPTDVPSVNPFELMVQECQSVFLGEGGFGRVYKGRLESSGQVVAVKQLDRNGLQGNREFLVGVLMLSLLHHPNLVNLIGYCADGDQRLLVYEFMPSVDRDERRSRDERVGRILKNKEGGGSGRRWDFEGSEKDDSPIETARMLNRDLDRERAVAEAKMWGENWREKRRQGAQCSFDGNNG